MRSIVGGWCSRNGRARSVELWAALKYLGKDGINELILGLHHRALQFGEELKAEGFHILNEIIFNQVVVACDTDELTSQTMKNVQRSGECWVGGAIWAGITVIRISVCSWVTTESDVARSVRAFVAARQKAFDKYQNI